MVRRLAFDRNRDHDRHLPPPRRAHRNAQHRAARFTEAAVARIERERASVDHHQFNRRLVGQRRLDGGQVFLDVEPAGDGLAMLIDVGEIAQGLNAPHVGAGRGETGLDDSFGTLARKQQYVFGFGEVGLVGAASRVADRVRAETGCAGFATARKGIAA